MRFEADDRIAITLNPGQSSLPSQRTECSRPMRTKSRYGGRTANGSVLRDAHRDVSAAPEPVHERDGRRERIQDLICTGKRVGAMNRDEADMFASLDRATLLPDPAIKLGGRVGPLSVQGRLDRPRPRVIADGLKHRDCRRPRCSPDSRRLPCRISARGSRSFPGRPRTAGRGPRMRAAAPVSPSSYPAA